MERRLRWRGKKVRSFRGKLFFAVLYFGFLVFDSLLTSLFQVYFLNQCSANSFGYFLITFYDTHSKFYQIIWSVLGILRHPEYFTPYIDILGFKTSFLLHYFISLCTKLLTKTGNCFFDLLLKSRRLQISRLQSFH